MVRLACGAGRSVGRWICCRCCSLSLSLPLIIIAVVGRPPCPPLCLGGLGLVWRRRPAASLAVQFNAKMQAYARYLDKAATLKFTKFEVLQPVYVSGTDAYGRPVVVVCGSHFQHEEDESEQAFL
jgi:hypothetical protein